MTGELTALSMKEPTMYAIQKGDRYTVFCEMSAVGELNVVTFSYDGTTHSEWKKPWYMNGNGKSNPRKVDYLTANCGAMKTFEVVGKVWKGQCFRAAFVLESACV
jgi:hypothetical protein